MQTAIYELNRTVDNLKDSRLFYRWVVAALICLSLYVVHDRNVREDTYQADIERCYKQVSEIHEEADNLAAITDELQSQCDNFDTTDWKEVVPEVKQLSADHYVMTVTDPTIRRVVLPARGILSPFFPLTNQSQALNPVF